MTRHTDPTKRFSERVGDYVRFRPTYPGGVLQILHSETGLTSASVIADVGSGTGISSRLFVDNGNTVFGVEPNPEMRGAAEAILGRHPRFHSVAGRAEATTLSDQSVDYVVAGQAFHWFDVQKARQEFARILRPGGWVVLLWNSRRSDSTPFLQSYEALLQKYGTDYRQVQHRNISDATLRTFFSDATFASHRLYVEQRLDYEGLKGRLLSSSYVPDSQDPQSQPMLDELAKLFRRHQVQNQVVLEYDTEMYFGRLT